MEHCNSEERSDEESHMTFYVFFKAKNQILCLRYASAQNDTPSSPI